jgi:hypothetical protein
MHQWNVCTLGFLSQLIYLGYFHEIKLSTLARLKCHFHFLGGTELSKKVHQGAPNDTSDDGHGITPVMQAWYDCTSSGMERERAFMGSRWHV